MLFQGSRCFTAGLRVHKRGEVVCIVDADVEIGAAMCEPLLFFKRESILSIDSKGCYWEMTTLGINVQIEICGGIECFE